MALDNEAVLTVVLRARNELSGVLSSAGMQVEALGAKARGSGLATGATGAGGVMGFEERRALGLFPGMGQAAGLMGFTPGMMAVGAAGLGAAELIKFSQDLVGRYREETRSLQDLRQATDVAGEKFDTVNKGVDKWIEANAPYIENVSQAREGFAELTRVGLDQKDATLAMTDALDLSALKHIDLSTAVEDVTKLTQGQARSLIDLGVRIKGYDSVTGELIVTEQKRNLQAQITALEDQARSAEDDKRRATSKEERKKLDDQIAALKDKIATLKDQVKGLGDGMVPVSQRLVDLHDKVKDGTKNFDDLQKATDKYNQDMEKLAHDVGPALLRAMSDFVTHLDMGAQRLDAFANWAFGNAHPNVNMPHGPWRYADRQQNSLIPSTPSNTIAPTGQSSGTIAGNIGL